MLFSRKKKKIVLSVFNMENSREAIKKYEDFLNSSFNQKRDYISLFENKIIDLIKEIGLFNEKIKILMQ